MRSIGLGCSMRWFPVATKMRLISTIDAPKTMAMSIDDPFLLTLVLLKAFIGAET